nr:alpha/beta hydrolase [Paraburkholderia bannensis]
MAINNRGTAPGILHSDQGTTYSATEYRALLSRHAIREFQRPVWQPGARRTLRESVGQQAFEAGGQGHLNADSNLGNWLEGFRLLQSLA